MSKLIRFAICLAAVAMGYLLLAPGASAHAVVVGSTPADGSRLTSSPSSVTIRFDEPVGLELGYLRVVDSSGRRVDSGTAQHPNGNGAAISVALKSGLGDGTYLASFRVISDDSHPVAGSVRWVVGNGALGAVSGPSGSAPVNQVVSSGLAVSHWLSFAGIGVVGGSWLIFTVWPSGRQRDSIRRLIWTGWTVGVIGAVAEFVLQGPYAAGSGPGAMLRGSLLDATLHANSGQLLSVRLVLLGVLGFVLTGLFGRARELSWAPELAAIVGVGIVVTFAASGHAQAAHPRWLAVLIDALHFASMMVWLGGLAVLLTAAVTRRRAAPELVEAGSVDASIGPPDGAEFNAEAADATAADDDRAAADDGDAAGDRQARELAAGLPIFSRVALGCVVVLAVTGTIQAWREIGSVAAITATRYGQLVLVKVVLFLGLVALGYLARRVLQRPVAGQSALSRLRRGLLVEVVVGAAVLAATGVLISQPPGNVALAAQRAEPRTTTVAVTSTAQAVVEVDPGVHGTVQVAIQLTGTITPTEVTATASLPAKELGPIPMTLQAVGPNSYSASGVVLPAAGNWQVTLTVRTSEFDSTTAVATVKVY